VSRTKSVKIDFCWIFIFLYFLLIQNRADGTFHDQNLDPDEVKSTKKPWHRDNVPSYRNYDRMVVILLRKPSPQGKKAVPIVCPNARAREAGEYSQAAINEPVA